MNPKSLHITIDIWLSDDIVNDNEKLREIMEQAIVESGSSIIGFSEYRFEPQGYSAVWLIAESHYSLHTFPEEGYISIDAYTCGNTDVIASLEYILKHIPYDYVVVQYIERGVKNPHYRIDIEKR